MMLRFSEEYPKFISRDCYNDIESRLNGRKESITIAKDIASRFGIEGADKLVKEEKTKWIDEDKFYREADTLIKKINTNGKQTKDLY